MIGTYEASLRERAVAARRRLFNPPTRKSAPLAIPPAPVVVEPVLFDAPKRKSGYGIIVEVAAKHGLVPADLTGQRRSKHITAARHEATFRIVMELDYSYPKAGRCMGGRDHTTAMNSVKAYARASEDAAVILAAHYKREADRNEQHRERCLEMLANGLQPNQVARITRITTGALQVWMGGAQ